MALEHSPLPLESLSPAVQKALAPGPGRLIASRGMLPFSTSTDSANSLYMLALDADAAIAKGARDTAAGFPEKLLANMLAQTDLDPRVLDWLAPTTKGKPAAFEALVLNPMCPDPTVAELAKLCDSKQVDLIAQNEQRFLRHPDILASLYLNPQARMSTIERAVELAVRNNVRVDGLPAWDEIERSIAGSSAPTAAEGAIVEAEQDALFAQVTETLAGMDDSALTTGNPDELGEIEEAPADAPEAGAAAQEGEDMRIPINQMSIPMKLRLASLGNAFARSQLIRDPIKLVAMATIKSGGVTDIEASKYAANSGLIEDVIRYIANNRNWTRLYGIKMNLVLNPKTPTGDALRFMPHLRDKDLRNVAKSKGVPSVIAATARNMIAAKAPGAKKK